MPKTDIILNPTLKKTGECSLIAKLCWKNNLNRIFVASRTTFRAANPADIMTSLPLQA